MKKLIQTIRNWWRARKLRRKENRRELRNLLGRRMGFGSCNRCGDTWNWKESGNVQYAPNRGMFPVCRECQDEISDVELYSYCKELVKSWANMGTPVDEENTLLEVRKALGLES